MEKPEVQHAAGQVDIALESAHQYAYFQLLELLYHVHDDDLEQRPLSRETRRRLRLEVSPSLSFPVADVLRADRLKDDRYRIQASFLGLHGTDSPLPTYYLDEIAYENAHGIGLRPAFFNFFNHRLHTGLFAAQGCSYKERYLFSARQRSPKGLGNLPHCARQFLSRHAQAF